MRPFVGLGTGPHTAEELFLIENILGQLCEWCYSSLSAQSYLEKVNPNGPSLCRGDFVCDVEDGFVTHVADSAVRQRLSAAVLCLAVQQPVSQSHSVAGTLAPDGLENYQ